MPVQEQQRKRASSASRKPRGTSATRHRNLTAQSLRSPPPPKWNARNAPTPDEIFAFYRDSTSLADDLEMFHRDEERQRWTAALVYVAGGIRDAQRTLEQPEDVRVVDIGAGAGHDARALRDSGF